MFLGGCVFRVSYSLCQLFINNFSKCITLMHYVGKSGQLFFWTPKRQLFKCSFLWLLLACHCIIIEVCKKKTHDLTCQSSKTCKQNIISDLQFNSTHTPTCCQITSSSLVLFYQSIGTVSGSSFEFIYAYVSRTFEIDIYNLEDL